MAGLTNYGAQKLLGHITGQSAFTMPTTSVALFTAVGTDAGTGFTEVSGGGYARSTTSGASWNAPSGGGPSTITNASAIAFPTSSANWTTIIAAGLYDASTGGNLLWWDFLGNDPWYPFTNTVASPSVFTAPGITAGSSPTLANGASVVLDAEWGGGLTSAFTAYTTYTVAGLSNDTFNLGVNQTTGVTGSGMVRQVATQQIPANITFSFAAGALILALT